MSEGDETQARLHVHLVRQAQDGLTELRRLHREDTVTNLVNRAITIYAFFEAQMASGKHVQLIDENGETYAVTWITDMERGDDDPSASHWTEWEKQMSDPIVVDLSATPANPTQDEIDAAMVIVSAAMGETWTARRLGAQFAFTDPNGALKVSRRRDFREAVADVLKIEVITTPPPGPIPTDERV